jgi:hypothetical protein
MGNGKQISIYVNGNLYIKSNIKYDYSSLGQIPRLDIIVQGNIYIDPQVTELHGVYVAQKISGTNGGYLYTCEPGAVTTAQPYSTCNTQLKVFGSVAAENGVLLERTYGNLASAPGVSDQPAEIFQYTPELWLSAPPAPDFPYNSYSNLPPVL